jgi:uncharacterized protein YbaR (Trm112 family)
MEDFLKAIQKDPGLIARLQKTEELWEFKKKYNVERASPLKCPACSPFFRFPGTLWVNKDDNTKFVCRKCKLEFTIVCNTVPNSQLLDDLKKMAKGELEKMPDWYPKGFSKEEE